MVLAQALIFLFLGAGMLLMVYQSLARGWLPMGPKGFSGRAECLRSRNPLLYWLLFVLYSAAGCALTVFALRLLAGSAAPLPLQ